jgi:hypothetical protein
MSKYFLCPDALLQLGKFFFVHIYHQDIISYCGIAIPNDLTTYIVIKF